MATQKARPGIKYWYDPVSKKVKNNGWEQIVKFGPKDWEEVRHLRKQLFDARNDPSHKIHLEDNLEQRYLISSHKESIILNDEGILEKWNEFIESYDSVPRSDKYDNGKNFIQRYIYHHNDEHNVKRMLIDELRKDNRIEYLADLLVEIDLAITMKF